MSLEEFEEHMFGMINKDKYDKTDVYATFQAKIDLLVKEDRLGSADVYKYVMRSFQKYRDNLKFHQVNVPFLDKYERAMTKMGLKKSTIGIRMKHMRAIVNMAKIEGIVSPMDYPFGRQIHHKYEIPTSKQPKKALSTRELIHIKNYEVSDKDAWSRDLWMFSFYCNGMNFNDIFNLKWGNIDGDFVYFVRQKTKNMCRHEIPVEVFLPKEAMDIIDKWAVGRKSKNNYVFGIFDDSMASEEKIKAKKFALRVINDNMNRIAKKLNIEKRVTSFVSRHTWTTILMQNGVPISYISKGLGHTSVKTTENYLADFEQDYKRDVGNILSNGDCPKFCVNVNLGRGLTDG